MVLAHFHILWILLEGLSELSTKTSPRSHAPIWSDIYRHTSTGMHQRRSV